MAKHALLSPSGASRWLACTPSAVLESKFPDKSSKATDEGTLAHKLSERLLAFYLELISQQERDLAVRECLDEYIKYFADGDEKKGNEEFLLMLGYCEDYAAFVLERFAEAKSRTRDAMIFLEQYLDLTEYVPKGFGTGDSVIIADLIMDLTDLKYGKGVFVAAERNKQMMLYALGALAKYDSLYSIEKVRLTIYQPRMDNYSSWELSVEELKAWAAEELVPKAKLAIKGKGEFVAGQHCMFCRAKATCKANAEYNLSIAQAAFDEPVDLLGDSVPGEMKDSPLLTDEQIARILERSPMLSKWVKAVSEHALSESVNHGKKWLGFKLVEGRSNRKYSDPEQVVNTLKEKGFDDEQLYTRKILSFTAMTGLLGKAVFKEAVEPLLVKPPGKPALVPESDKRVEFSSLEAAQAAFAEEYEGEEVE
jgi:hypothetical protein